jgi:regulator of sirC expression with transglutaminase-like and TPR domain
VPPAEVVATVLAAPDDRLDYARAKIAFDEIVDPTINSAAVQRELARLTNAASELAGASEDYKVKLGAVRRAIYDAGAWNGGRPFIYDPDDPLGRNLHHKLLSDYLISRRGNCVSMPVLFLILADRLGVKGIALANAPLHDLIRFTDPAGRTFNIETTSGAHNARDEWYRQQMPMGDRALQSGIYLRSLTRREAIADLATVVVDYLIAEGRSEEAIAVSEVILKNYPRDAYAMVKEGTAYGQLLETEFTRRFPTPALIPSTLRPRYFMLAEKNQELFARAEALGWQP